jgi:hypothetical protein|tara:strand:+ start:1745 stop:2020 length:276 start_codon:yes stop_codon:yes gene_type:complete
MIIEILLGCAGVIVITETYVIWNLMRKTELLETWVEDFSDRIVRVQEELTEIDSTGHFESDDEVGTIFQSIKEVVNDINDLSEKESISEQG